MGPALPPNTRWDEISRNLANEEWSNLDDQERVKVWAEADEKEREVIADINNEIDLAVLSHRANKYKRSKLGKGLGHERLSSLENTDDTSLDAAQFELERIHRERVETELKTLSDTLKKHVNLTEHRSEKRRAENIYILVALGIVGGFVTFKPNLMIDGIIDIIALVFALSSALFILVKLITVNVAEIGAESIWIRLDNIADKSFPAVITGVFILGTAAVIITAFNIEAKELGNVAAALTSTLAAFLTFAYRITRELEVDDDRPISYNEVIERLFELSESEDQEAELNDVKHILDDFSSGIPSTNPLEKVKDRLAQIEGISANVRKEIDRYIDELMEEKLKEVKTEDELRQLHVEELEEEREKYRNEVREEIE